MRLRLPSNFIRYPAARRAAIALIVRPSVDGKASNLGSYETLLIKRREAQGDPWSGNLACPGGKLEPGEDIVDAAVRETWEEVGLNLHWPRPAPPTLHPDAMPHIGGANPAVSTIVGPRDSRQSWGGGVDRRSHWDLNSTRSTSIPGSIQASHAGDPSSGSIFQFAGRLDDRYIYARGKKDGAYVLSTAVFMSKRPETPELRLSDREVDAAFWCPL